MTRITRHSSSGSTDYQTELKRHTETLKTWEEENQYSGESCDELVDKRTQFEFNKTRFQIDEDTSEFKLMQVLFQTVKSERICYEQEIDSMNKFRKFIGFKSNGNTADYEDNMSSSNSNISLTVNEQLLNAVCQQCQVKIQIVSSKSGNGLLFSTNDIASVTCIIAHVFGTLYAKLIKCPDEIKVPKVSKHFREILKQQINTEKQWLFNVPKPVKETKYQKETTQSEKTSVPMSLFAQYRQIQKYDNFEETIADTANCEWHKKLLNEPNNYFKCRIQMAQSKYSITGLLMDYGGTRKVEVKFTERCSFPVKQDEIVIVHISQKITDGSAKGVVKCKYYKEQKYKMMKMKDLEPLMKKHPKNYKLCVLKLRSVQEAKAVPVNKNDDLQHIELKGRENCGRACDGDVVVVHVAEVNGTVGHGFVVGVHEQRFKLLNKLFICKILPDEGTLMRPLCDTVPKIRYDNSFAEEFYANEIFKLNQNQEFKQKMDSGMGTLADEKRRTVHFANESLVSVYTPVRRLDSKGRAIFQGVGTEKVLKHDCETLFVVCCKGWNTIDVYPFGNVVYVIRGLRSDIDAMTLFRNMFELPNPIEMNLSEAIRKEIKEINRKSLQLKKETCRKDYTSHLTVTIDNPSTTDMDDAISFKKIADGKYVVGVHITDVSHFVLEGSHLDNLVATRTTTVYPSKEFENISPVHMFPREIASKTLSLTPNELKACLAVVFTFDLNSFQMDYEIEETLIKSDQRLNKEDVQRVILGLSSIDNQVDNMLKVLWGIAKTLRTSRLGMAAFVVNNSGDHEIGKTFEVEALVEEFMILANQTVGEFLVSKHVSNFLTRVQDEPNDAAVEAWLDKYEAVVSHSAKLERHMRDLKQDICNENLPLSIYSNDYDVMMNCKRSNPRYAAMILNSEERHPQTMIALQDWYRQNQPAYYQVFDSKSKNKHFDLSISNYTHFTSPLRRYADITVHRSLKKVLRVHQTHQYETKSLEDIGADIRKVEKSRKRYEKECASFEMAHNQMKQPQEFLCVVSEISEANVEFSHLLLYHISGAHKAVKLAYFGLNCRPEKLCENKYKVSWRKQIFCHSTDEHFYDYAMTTNNSCAAIKVKGNHDVYTINSEKVRAIKAELVKSFGTFTSCTKLISQLTCNSNGNRCVDVATSEQRDSRGNMLANTFVNFFTDISIGNTMNVQFYSTKNNNIPVPNVQLINVCKTYQHCVEHRQKPVECFAPGGAQPTKDNYNGIQEYSDIWMKVLQMESATIAGDADDSISILNVPVLLCKTAAKNNKSGRWLGIFSLDDKYCLKRQIKFTDGFYKDEDIAEKINFFKNEQAFQDPIDELVKYVEDENLQKFVDYICIKHKRKSEKHESWTWVGHGGILASYQSVHNNKIICGNKSRDKLHNCIFIAFTIPNLTDEDAKLMHTRRIDVEIIKKFLPNRRQENAMEILPHLESNCLAQKVALLGTAEQPIDDTYFKVLKKKGVNSFQIDVSTEDDENEYTEQRVFRRKNIPCNNSQKRALENAMTKPLTLIWGPPGTGKTSTGVMLTYWLVFINRNIDKENKKIIDDNDSEIQTEYDDDDDSNSDISDDTATTINSIDYNAYLHNSDDEDDDNGWNLVTNSKNKNQFSPILNDLERLRQNSENSEENMIGTFKIQNMEENKCQTRRQVLYCGPSNRSVDVVAEYLIQKLEHKCPKIIRVFSEQMEIKEYPVPGEISYNSRLNQDADTTEQMKQIALHQIIRKTVKYGPNVHILWAYDYLFKTFIGSGDFGHENLRRCVRQTISKFSYFQRHIKRLEMQERRVQNWLERDDENGIDLLTLTSDYHKIVKDLKKIALQDYEVILCTTSVACSGILQEACKFCQIIIDEAGMCTEPETLVPLVGNAKPNSSNPASLYSERLVLIGDHKQLSPIIQNKTAASLGLARSLFERHCSKAIMLNFQYRMHPSLADFPSEYFYRTADNAQQKLQTKLSTAWTGLGNDDLDSQFMNYNVVQWNGLNAHLCVKMHAYDDFTQNYKISGKLSNENSNILLGHWKGKTKPGKENSNEKLRLFRSMPIMEEREIHPMGEEHRIMFIHVDGREEKVTVATEEGHENSRKNQREIDAVLTVFKEMRQRYNPPRQAEEHIAVLSQYRYQVNDTRNQLMQKDLAKKPQVKTVIAAQGSEFDYVILSLVRSLPYYEIPNHATIGWEKEFLGFITDENQINVALTRARRGLIIIGNKNILRVNRMWRNLIDNLERRNCVVNNLKEFPESTGDHRVNTPDGKMHRNEGYAENTAWTRNQPSIVPALPVVNQNFFSQRSSNVQRNRRSNGTAANPVLNIESQVEFPALS